MIAFVGGLPFAGFFFARLIKICFGLESAVPAAGKETLLAARWAFILLLISLFMMFVSGTLIDHLGLLDGPG